MELSLEQQKRLTYIDAAILQAELWAKYWLTMVTSGEAARRKLYRPLVGGAHEQLTEPELIADAMRTAASHIEMLPKLARNRALVLENRLSELEA